MIKIPLSNAGHAGSIPGWRAKLPHASWPKNQIPKQKQHCNKFNKDLKWSTFFKKGFPGGSEGKESACNAGDWGSVPESGRSPGEGNSSPLQYSCLENPMDGITNELLSMWSQRVRHD